MMSRDEWCAQDWNYYFALSRHWDLHSNQEASPVLMAVELEYRPTKR